MVNTTDHALVVEDARDLSSIPTDSVDLVVTSPPYPMVEMWDDAFEEMRPAIGEALSDGDGETAFQLMHEELEAVWDQLKRVVVGGGIVAINIGDATRSINGTFQQYPNHAAVIDSLRERGFHNLPTIFWKKSTNSPTKFLGSGCIPPNQYATLGHEYILIFRHGERRSFEPNYGDRYESAYFWEERNEWFSDQWTDIQGVDQSLDGGENTSRTNGDGKPQSERNTQPTGESRSRERSAAFPFEVPYRLIHMFSIFGDTVLDPFAGTGTTNLAAMVAGRNSVGVDLHQDILQTITDEIGTLPKLSRKLLDERVEQHQRFVAKQRRNGDELTTDTANYPFPVMTQQETDIRFYEVVDDSNVSLDEVNPFSNIDWRPDVDAAPVTRKISYTPYSDRIPTSLRNYE